MKFCSGNLYNKAGNGLISVIWFINFILLIQIVMKKEAVLTEERTLDPQNWSTLNELGHRMLDDLFYYLETSRQRQVYTKPTTAAINSMQQLVPRAAAGGGFRV